MTRSHAMLMHPPGPEAQGFVARFAAIARRQGVIDGAARSARVLAITLGVLLLIILLDAWMAMSPWLRLTLALMWLGFLVWSCRPREGWIANRWPKLARSIEERTAIANNRVTNAVCLAGAADPKAESLTAVLARRSLARGDAALEAAEQSRLVSRANLHQQVLRLCFVLAVWAALLITIPRLPLMGLARVIMPWGDFPPFSLTQFAVTVTPIDEVPYGGDATVRVELTGKLPAVAELIELDDAGEAVRHLPMREVSRSDERVVLERKLTGLSKATTFHIEATTGRSKRSRIAVGEPPATVPQTAGADTATNDSTATPQREAAARAAELSQMSERIREKAAELKARLQGLAPGEPVPDWLREQLEALKQDLERFTGRSQSLEELLKNLMDSGDSSLSKDAKLTKALGDMIYKLRQLNLPNVKGTPVSSNLQATQQASELEQAAAKDSESLRGGLSQLDDLLGGLTKTGGSLVPTVIESPDPRGTYDAITQGGTLIDPSDARLRHVPLQYRELVAKYFLRVAKDAE